MSKDKVAYEVDGELLLSLSAVSEVLGEKVTKKDIEEGKYSDSVQVVELAEEDEEEVKDVLEGKTKDTKSAKPNKEVKKVDAPSRNTEEVYTALSAEDMENLQNITPEEIEAAFPKFDTIDELKDFMKDIDTSTLEYMATGLGLDWKPTYHPNIHRMRISMAIQKHYFPELFKPKEAKKKAKYGDFSTDELFEMAQQNDIEVKKSGNEPIDRMRVIMKLKESGVLEE